MFVVISCNKREVNQAIIFPMMQSMFVWLMTKHYFTIAYKLVKALLLLQCTTFEIVECLITCYAHRHTMHCSYVLL